MKPKAPVNPAPPAPPIPLAPIQLAMRQSPAVRAALAPLRPADRIYASKAIGDAIAAQLRRKGISQ
ncbi:MAG TPA: hypothetical protein VII56_05400 [Rhizomicrobium sp.]